MYLALVWLSVDRFKKSSFVALSYWGVLDELRQCSCRGWVWRRCRSLVFFVVVFCFFFFRLVWLVMARPVEQ